MIRGCSGSHIDVGVVEELGGDVGAAFLLGRFGHIGIAVPLPAGAVGVAGGWGSVLHPCGRYDSHRLAYRSGIVLIRCINWRHMTLMSLSIQVSMIKCCIQITMKII